MKKFIIFPFVLLSFLLAEVAVKKDINEIKNVEMDKNKFIKELKGLVEANPYVKDANYTLGIYYMAGDIKNGREPDFQKAKFHLLKDKDNLAMANFKIAELYYYGYGVRQDYQKAIQWFKRAINEDFKDARAVILRARLAIGETYLMKLQDGENAFPYFLKVAQENNEASAQMTVAFMYLEGKGVDKNKEEANYWINKAYFNPHVESFQKVFMARFIESVGEYNIQADLRETCNAN